MWIGADQCHRIARLHPATAPQEPARVRFEPTLASVPGQETCALTN